MPLHRHVALVSVACGAILACADGTTPRSPVVPVLLPTNGVFSATAEGHDADMDVDCSLEFTASLHAEGSGYRGSMGGEAQRRALNPDGSGRSFFADAFYPDIRIEVHADHSATIVAYDQDGKPWAPTGESRFWDAILSFSGSYDESTLSLNGEWECRPMDTHEDSAGVVRGQWTLHAQ